MSVAIEVVLLNLIFIWGGIKLDELLDWSPAMLIVGVIFATSATIYYLLVKLNR